MKKFYAAEGRTQRIKYGNIEIHRGWIKKDTACSLRLSGRTGRTLSAMFSSNLALCSAFAVLTLNSVNANYWEDRRIFLKDEAKLFMGASNQLNAVEESANSILMKAKSQEFADYFENQLFPPARHFFFSKADIEKSQIFHILRKLPKGSLLHGHDMGLVSLKYIITKVTYRENLYSCIKFEQGNLTKSILEEFKFSAAKPGPSTKCQWILMDDLRLKFGNAAVDAWLHGELSLITDNPKEKYPNVDAVWDYFNRLFIKVIGLLTYLPVFRDLYLQILKELLQDNVMYLEMRCTLPELYDLSGKIYKGVEIFQIYKEATDEFKSQNPDFFGARCIYSPVRLVNNATFEGYLTMVQELHKQFPDFLAGFDLVGQEDKGRPLSDFAEGILSLPSDIKLFFHAGETNWQGMTDMNLVDAVLLNATRIGHGYGIMKHPLVMKQVKDRGIGIEVNPISNQVLALVDDLRNHPAGALIAENFPVVISSDDPTFWEAYSLSHDFYEAFMGLAGKDADLRFLKQLSMNSIIYSVMPPDEKARAIDIWTSKWNEFINQVHSRNHANPLHMASFNSGTIL